MWGIIKENNPIWYFDATGKLMPKYKDQGEVLLYSIVSHDTTLNIYIPIADFLTSANDSLTIYSYLNKIIEKYKSYSFFEYPKVLVTDFSWANVNASMRALNNCETFDYLLLSFEVLVKKNDWAFSRINTIIYLCSTHILKNVIDETDKILKNNTEVSNFLKKTFINAFCILINCVCFETFCEVLKCIQSVFCSKNKTKSLVDNVAKLDCLFLKRNVDWLRSISEQSLATSGNKHIFFAENNNINLTNDSPFTSFFENMLNENKKIIDELTSEKNLFYQPALFDIIKRKLHIAPLWSGFLLNKKLKEKTRQSNNPVEGWFKFFKNNILNLNKRVRSCRLLFLSEIATPLYFYLSSKYKENYEDMVNIKFKALNTNRKLEEKEMWSFNKPLKTNVGYFNMDLKVEKYADEEFKKDVENKPLFELFDDYNTSIYETLDHLSKNNQNKISDFENNQESINLNEIFDNSLRLNEIQEANQEAEIIDNKDLEIVKLDSELKSNHHTINDYDYIYFKIDEFLIRKSSLDRLLSNKWLSDNVNFLLI